MTEYKNRSMIQRRLIPSYIFLTIVSFISVFPLYWMITAATNKSVDVARGKIVFGSYLMENWARLNQLQDLGGAMKNSFVYALVQTILALLMCSLAGFGFELYHDKKKDLLVRGSPYGNDGSGVATMIPLFKMMSSSAS